MSNEEIKLEDTGKFHLRKLRKRPELDGRKVGFNVVHDLARRQGTYRPIRNLPSMITKGDFKDNEGYVWPQGKALGKYDRRIYAAAWKYQADVQNLGVSNVTTGKWYAYNNAETGNPEEVEFDDGYMGNGINIDGFLGPMNGTSADIQDFFGSLDVPYNFMDPVLGTVLTAANVITGVKASLRDADGGAFQYVGIAQHDTMRETRNNNYQYQRKIAAITVARECYVTLPFVVKDANTIAALDAGTAIPDIGTWNTDGAGSKQRSVSLDQTVMFVDNPALLISGASVLIDAWGNPILIPSGGNFTGVYGTLVDFTHDVRTPWAKWVDTYPEMDVTGTGTGGIDGSIFYLIKKIEEAYSRSVAIDTLVALAENTAGYYGYATIYVDTP